MKKILSVILVTFMILSMNVQVFAVEPTDTNMEEMVVTVKERLDITDSNKFRSSTSNMEDGMVHKNLYNLSWEFDDKNTYVEIREDGFISEYSSYNTTTTEEERKLLFTVTKAEAKATADSFIKQLNPDIADQYVFQNIERASYRFYFADMTSRLSGDTYVATYARTVNNIPFKADIMTVHISGYTNEVKNYSGSYHANINFPDPAEKISLEEAKSIFKDNLTLEYTYEIKHVYEEDENGEYVDKPYTVLVYTDETEDTNIDALTRGVYSADERYYSYSKYNNNFGAVTEDAMNATGSVEGSSSKYDLTEEEQTEIADTKDVLQPEQVLEKIKNTNYFSIPTEAKIKSYRLFKNKDNSKEYSLVLETYKDSNTISITADANTAEVKYYSDGTRHHYTNNNTTVGKVEIANKFVKNYFKHSDSIVLDEKYNKNTGVDFRYIRKENNIPCPDNYVSIEVDKNTDKISYYNYYWTDVEFIDPALSISLNEAQDIYIDNFEYKLYYYVDNKLSETIGTNRNATLTYTYTNPKSNILNAQTKEFLSYSLEKYNRYSEPEKIKVPENYTDISGHWAENIIKIMQNNNIGYESENFKPNDVLTFESLFELMGAKVTEEQFTEFINEFKDLEEPFTFISEETKLTDTISRENFVTLMIKIGTYNYEKIINKTDFFKTNYLDEANITTAKIGYISIARMLGYLSGDTFRPQDNITRAEALAYLYKVYTNL